MNEQSIESVAKETGVDRDGVQKGSRVVPLALLGVVVIMFVASVKNVQFAKDITHDFPIHLMNQLKTIGSLLLFSLFPGLLGMIYRRAFWAWFMGAFVILFAINWGFIASDAELEDFKDASVEVVEADSKVAENPSSEENSADSNDLKKPSPQTSGADSKESERRTKDWTESLFLFVEVLILLYLVAFRFRRQSVAAIDATRKRNLIIGAVLAIVLAFAWIYGMIVFEWLSVLPMLGIPLLLWVAYSILKQTLGAAPEGAKRKNIVVCLDGTWNEPGQTDYGYLAWTNVFKIFRMLKGTRSHKNYNASRCKEYFDDKDPRCLKQVAFYYHGVGNKVENSELGQLFGGAFGMGATAIVERAYLDVVRVYRPGDRIFIFGFSRGAAIARLVAGVIGVRGVPMSMWTLRFFGQHRTLWKSSNRLENVPVEVLGCWDTVGAFGISKDILGIPFQKINLLKDLTVSLAVKRAYHMVAMDENRDSFEPTLMNPDPTAPERIIEIWFSGNHANVGGGYATDKLSNVTLDFLLRHISSGYAHEPGMEPGDESWGLYLSAVRKGVDGDTEGALEIEQDPKGRLRQSSGGVYTYAPRELPVHAVVYDTVFERMKDAVPVYAPQSLFDLNEELVKKRTAIKTEVMRLVETHSINKAEADRIQKWSDKRLSLTKWSKYLETELPDKSKLKDKLNPETELSNNGVETVEAEA